MSDEILTNRFEQRVKVPSAQAYYAFTNATALREWMCDVASVLPRVGGRVYLYWNSGYYTAGEYTRLDPEKCIEFTWRGRGEPGATQVKVTLEPVGDATRVTLEHTGFGNGAEWKKPVQESRQGWADSLENLASVLETGQDLRITRRPMLGISLSDFSPEIARQLGVPVSDGIRIDGTFEGMGARKAGLLQHDVIVAMAGHLVTTYASLGIALQGRKAGDVIEVAFYRGPERMHAQMELSRRPLPDIPFEPKELSARLRRTYTELHAELAQLFEGVTDREATFSPAPDEWSALETVAHLLLGERFNSGFMIELLGGQERWSDDFIPNIPQQTRAVVAAYPSIATILDAYQRSQVETLALVDMFPAEFVERKGSYWRLAYGLLEGGVAGAHNRSHYDQIRSAIQSARQ
jgi:uncharacterized protein YndB with AHSA1/START domain